MSNALDDLVVDVDRLVSEMASNLPPDETSRSWYAAISAQFLSFNRRLRDAIKEERTSRQEMEKPREVNDMKAMREALEDSQSLLESFSRGGYGAQVREQMRDNQAALAKPPRQCDVGTADEQSERFENFCLKHIGCAEETGGRHCVGCPLEKASRNTTQKCELYWAQMPYVEKEGGAK